MEVAGQWRREWAGTAEYGKVTEGGVTRRVARAMEVLHASAPGTRVRVMRAAYHSSSGPGLPASSYLVHSSRQVLSSGYNFLEPSSLPSKPLEISSTPLETSPDSEAEKEDYKVTEPDDYDISEPSKWRGSSRKNSIRMPSEESSSADNASIIDLDTKSSKKSTLRKEFQSKENNDSYRIHNINTRISPLLDAPVALSTLKYTSILNGTDEWNNRRKSYSFEDTGPVDSISPGNNLFTMDSSTDSGICKSSEIDNDYSHIAPNPRFNNTEKMDNIQEETFREWLSKNRTNSYTRATPPKARGIHNSDSHEDKITLQPSGKITITLPIETYTHKQTEISKFTDEIERKTKKVGFCKTELHFAADTGTVNIIATDEKPPPSNDFRRRRSAFIPLNDKVERSITLFGEKNDTAEVNKVLDTLHSEFSEYDENTAATKSILKNKIPKPKPYLLGENMAIGHSDDNVNDLIMNSNSSKCATSAVSKINSQLLSERRSSNETISSCASDSSSFFNKPRTGNKGPRLRNDLSHTSTSNNYLEPMNNSSQSLIPTDIQIISPTSNRAKLRELRGTDLAYFGIEKNVKSEHKHSQDNLQEEIFNSVKLVQQISNSVCNSEAESDDAPEYQNIIKHNFLVTPTPKPRSKYGDEAKSIKEMIVLKPIIEQDTEKVEQLGRNRIYSKSNKEPLNPRHDSTELPKTLSDKSGTIDKKYNGSIDFSPARKNRHTSTKKVKSNKENETKKSNINSLKQNRIKSQEPPLYVNLKVKTEKNNTMSENLRHKNIDRQNSLKIESTEKKTKDMYTGQKESLEKRKVVNREKINEIRPEDSHHVRKHMQRRTEKLTTPENIRESPKEHSYSKEKSSTKTSLRNSKHKKTNREMLDKHESKNETNLNEITKLKISEDPITNSSETTVKITNKLSQPKNIHENKLPSRNNKGLALSQNSSKNNTNYMEKIPNQSQTSNNGIKLDKSAKSNRSKYVINYDDKNGTVSSICKINSGPGTYKRKLISLENKDAQKNNTNKSLNKISLRK